MIGWFRRLFRRPHTCDVCGREIDVVHGHLSVKTRDGNVPMQCCRGCWEVLELHR